MYKWDLGQLWALIFNIPFLLLSLLFVIFLHSDHTKFFQSFFSTVAMFFFSFQAISLSLYPFFFLPTTHLLFAFFGEYFPYYFPSFFLLFHQQQLWKKLLGVPEGAKDLPFGKLTPLECSLDYLNFISFSKGFSYCSFL